MRDFNKNLDDKPEVNETVSLTVNTNPTVITLDLNFPIIYSGSLSPLFILLFFFINIYLSSSNYRQEFTRWSCYSKFECAGGAMSIESFWCDQCLSF